MSIRKIVTIIKNIITGEIFKEFLKLKKEMWGSNLWTSGYYANTVGMYASKETIVRYIQNQGKEKKEYKKLHQGQFDFDM